MYINPYLYYFNYLLTQFQGQNKLDDEEFFRSKTVESCGQIIGAVIAVSEKIARRAAKLVKVRVRNYGLHNFN